MRGSSSTRQPRERLFVALDTPDVEHARTLARRLRGRVGGFKVGLELFCAAGPAVAREIGEQGRLFIDLKLHDIPNTVAGAASAVARLGAAYFTVHAAGGSEMMRRAVDASAEAADRNGLDPPVALAVTVLTSHDEATLRAIGMAGPCSEAVTRLCALARDAGAGGVVCSVLEIEAARRAFPDAVLVTPGIRPEAGVPVAGDDQTRVATAERAMALGADLLVVGRPVTRVDDPAAAADDLVDEIARATADR